jgi:hypothetical protein
MSEQVLTVLKFCLVAALYLFLARVVWVVAVEMRGTPAPADRPPPAGRARRRAWRLVVRRPEADDGREFWVDGEATLGRGAACTIPLSGDTFVSQVHARVVDRDGRLWVEDLGSTNGTFVNGKRIGDAVRVRRGDHLQVGETVLEVDR